MDFNKESDEAVESAYEHIVGLRDSLDSMVHIENEELDASRNKINIIAGHLQNEVMSRDNLDQCDIVRRVR